MKYSINGEAFQDSTQAKVRRIFKFTSAFFRRIKKYFMIKAQPLTTFFINMEKNSLNASKLTALFLDSSMSYSKSL